MNFSLLILLSFLPRAASALEAGKEELSIIGWNKACSVAVTHLSYPRPGQAVANEPIATRIGTLTVATGEEKARARWTIDWGGANSWLEKPAQEAMQSLIAAGYDDRGYREDIRNGIAPSTASLQARQDPGWPSSDWRLARLHFNRLGTCALAVFAQEGPLLRYVLTRVYNPKARSVRARAHLEEGLRLFDAGDLAGALDETGVAAAVYPEGAENRYHHAAMLCLSGELQESITELAEAVKLKPEYRKKALKDIDFESVAKQPRFRVLMKGE